MKGTSQQLVDQIVMMLDEDFKDLFQLSMIVGDKTVDYTQLIERLEKHKTLCTVLIGVITAAKQTTK